MSLYWTPLWLSLRVAGTATAIALAVCLWLVFAPQARRLQALSGFTLALVFLPSPMVCYALVSLSTSYVYPLTAAGLTACGVLSAGPLLLWGVRAAVVRLGPIYGNAARSLGSSEWRVCFAVELPLIFRPLAAALALAFLRVALETAVTYWIAGKLIT